MGWQPNTRKLNMQRPRSSGVACKAAMGPGFSLFGGEKKRAGRGQRASRSSANTWLSLIFWSDLLYFFNVPLLIGNQSATRHIWAAQTGGKVYDRTQRRARLFFSLFRWRWLAGKKGSVCMDKGPTTVWNQGPILAWEMICFDQQSLPRSRVVPRLRWNASPSPIPSGLAAWCFFPLVWRRCVSLYAMRRCFILFFLYLFFFGR
jgi:hypothetical protein